MNGLFAASWVVDEVAEKMRELAESLGGGAYFVKRGWIVWGAFPFEKYGRGLSIQIDQAALFPASSGDSCGFHAVSFSIEMAAKMQLHSKEPSIDDGIQAEMTLLARRILGKLVSVKRENGNNLVALVDTDSATTQEFHDASDRVQGVVVSFNLYL